MMKPPTCARPLRSSQDLLLWDVSPQISDFFITIVVLKFVSTAQTKRPTHVQTLRVLPPQLDHRAPKPNKQPLSNSYPVAVCLGRQDYGKVYTGVSRGPTAVPAYNVA